MAKRRYDAKKIAKQPHLKKRMAKFCSAIDIMYRKEEIDFEEILANGHRGYISFSEDDLAKEFDKRMELLKTKYSKIKTAEDERRINYRWYRQSNEFIDISLWYDEGIDIANEIFEEQVLG